MIYARLSIYQCFSAYVTATSETEFVDIFTKVVNETLSQYKEYFCCSICDERMEKFHKDMEELKSKESIDIKQLFYDMEIDGNGYTGYVRVDEIYSSREEVIEIYQPWVDWLNSEGDNLPEEEQWTVFGGFFSEDPGYEIDELFK